MKSKRETIKHFSNYFISSLVSGVIGLLTVYLLSKNLTLGEYGRLGLFFSTVALLTYFATMCSTGLIGIKVRECTVSEFDDFMSDYRKLIIIFGVVSYLFMVPVLYFINNLSLTIISISAIFTITQAQWVVTAQHLIHSINSKKYLFATSVVTIVTYLLTYMFVGFLEMGEQGRMFALIIGCLFPLVIIELIRLHKINRPINFILAREVVSFGVPLIIGSGAGWVLYHADKFFLLEWFGEKSVGIYAYGVSLAALLSLIISSIERVFIPKLYEKMAMTIRTPKAIFDLIKVWILLELFVIIISIFSIMVFVLYFGGKDFRNYSNVIFVLLLAYGLLPFVNVFGAILEYKKLNRLRTKIYYVAAAIFVLLAYLLKGALGLSSIAVSLIVAHIFLIIFNAIFAYHIISDN